QALRPGCEELAARIRKATARRCRTAGAEGDGSAAPRPKTATVERREASVPRHGTQGASLGTWRAALCARPTDARWHPNVSRRSAPSSDNRMNLLGNSGGRGAIPGFFPVCKTGVVTRLNGVTPTRPAADAEQLQQHLDLLAAGACWVNR